MSLSTLTNDQLADQWKALLDETHARAEALPASTFKFLFKERLSKLHVHADRLKGMTSDEGVIQPLSGGTPKP